jgi:hypothetical protein
MSTAETVFVIVVVTLLILAIGNFVFSVVAERRNPPIGTFTECEVCDFIISIVVIPPLLAWCCSMAMAR